MKHRMLVVDDEEALLHLLQKYLVRLDYEVDTAASAEEALGLLNGGSRSYELFLIDLTLTGMQGDALALRILEHDRSARILLTSGYPYETVRLPANVRDQVGFLQKPFLPRQLAEMLNQMTRKPAG